MYLLSFMDSVFSFETRDQYELFLKMIFTHSINGKILYMTLADSMVSWAQRVCKDDVDENPGMAVIRAMVVFYEIYGVIYDPDSRCFGIRKNPESGRMELVSTK